MQKQELIKIIYASTSGNVEIVCEYVSKLLDQMGFQTKLLRAEKTNITEITNHNLFIFATSTWEHGAINPFFSPLLAEMKKSNLSGKYAGIIGLGDTRYEKHLFCEGAESLKRGFVGAGGTVVHVPLKINGEPYEILDTVVADWTKYFVKSLKDVVK